MPRPPRGRYTPATRIIRPAVAREAGYAGHLHRATLIQPRKLGPQIEQGDPLPRGRRLAVRGIHLAPEPAVPLHLSYIADADDPGMRGRSRHRPWYSRPPP